MPAGTDIFDAFERAAHIGLLIAVIFVICVVCLRRTHAKRRGGYASCGSIGFAMQQLQAVARPPIEHQLKEQEVKGTREGLDEDEDDEGDPDDPSRYYRRLQKRIDQNHAVEAEKRGETD